ncbi:MAG: Stk1 family PASTA domain-containing Ser/Thr kinase [Pseudonocardiales bacterium]|nr:Stk1 family PASTA domain-containing Ser/Thr kinase [Actinomycetota bacterium]
MQTATTDPLVGRTLEGRYRIVDRIARGGMSTVYAAVDERLDRLVAVKVMSSALSADPAFSDRFTREARAAARLSHLNAVSVYDQGHDKSVAGHHVFLVMELVAGRTLRELIRERGRLTPAEAVSIMEPVLSALSAAHLAGLVHRDVKPENILLSHEGIVKVADFGLARAVESDASATRTGLMMGTVAYCAPEQISRGRADQRSDVYSAGIVMFELLTGAPPYQGESAMSVAYQHVHSRVPAPSSRVKGIPTEIDELVVCATDRDPEGRPADAGEFLAELADVRTDLALPVVAVPPSPRTRTRATTAPPPRPRATAANGATTDVFRRQVAGEHDTAIVPNRNAAPRQAVGPPPPPPVVTPPSRRSQASPAARRRRRSLIILLIVILVGLAAGYGGWWLAAGRYSHVPKVLGSTYARALHDLQQAGYKVARQPAPEFSESVPRDRVLRTQPGPDSRVPRGRTITVVLSGGPERFSLPKDVANKTPEQVRSQLASIPVDVATDLVPEASDTVREGLVVRTSPAAGASVKRGDEVRIYVSTGRPIIAIPNVDPGTPFDQAAQTLKAAGFAPKKTDAFSDSIAKDGVISVDPTGTARKGATITVTVSKGPELIAVPEIPSGTRPAQAKIQLERLGFKVKIVKHFGGILDEVVGIDPQSGTMVPPGTVITLDVV